MNKKVKVSIIVPIYNVEEYLRECLDSLVNQTLKEIEVIMIDDGSTDSSGKIADEYAKKYDNFYNITKENGGLGQARNFGVQFVNGEYLIFLDSDDYVPNDAYEKMYDMAIKTGNDIVIGNVKRFNSQKVFASGLHKKVFKDFIEKTHILEFPELVYDTTSWNKLFKVSFWLENKFEFPEAILYEDIPVTVPAHFKANGVSILKDTVYYWRVRDGISKSITQNRTEIKNFTDRLEIMKMVDSFYETNVSDKEANYYKDFKWLDMDFKLYINELLNADKTYIDVLISEICEYLKNIEENVLTDLKAIDRIKYYLIEKKDVKTLLEVVKYEKTQIKYLSVKKVGKEYFGEFPFVNIPKYLFNMTRELNLTKEYKKVEKIYWNKNIMNIEGYMYIPRVNISKSTDRKMQVKLVNIENNKMVSLNYENIKRTDITNKSGVKIKKSKFSNRLYNYNWAGFKIEIDFSKQEVLDLGEGNLKVLIQYETDGINKAFYLGEPVAGKNPRPLPSLMCYQKVITHYNLAYDLIISMYNQSAGVLDISIKEEKVILKCWMTEKSKILFIDWENDNKKYLDLKEDNSIIVDEAILKEYGKVKTYKIIIPFESFKYNLDESEWYLYYYKNSKREPLIANQLRNTIYHIYKDNLMILKISSAGTVMIKYDKLRTYIEEVRWINNKIEITTSIGNGKFNNDEKIENVSLLLKGEKTNRLMKIKSHKNKENEKVKRFIFEIDLENIECYKEFLADIWLATIEYKTNTRVVSHMILSESIVHKGKKGIMKHWFKSITTKKGYFALNVSSKWNWYEKGPRRREFIERYMYPIFRRLPIQNNKIVFEGWWGDKYHCNPKYLYKYINENYPQYDCIWSVKDENINIDGNCRKVKRGGLKYYYNLATAKYFVNNVNFEDSFEKRLGAVEIQTMHGTPLKTLGLDVPGEFPTQEHIDRFLRRCNRWDHLVVQSDTVEKITRSCYKYSKNYLKTGYPRNDILFKGNNEKTINEIKEELNIPNDKKVILYAPTWRIKDKFNLMLDINEMQKKLGDEYVLVLRIHPFAVKGLDKKILNDFVFNCSDYESVEKLYLIADIMITDYSSVMFDYAILNRPVLFFTYDLELYRDNLRGFNLNLEKEAPGPLLYTSDQVIKSIEQINNVNNVYKKRYNKFTNKFCKYEKGNAAEMIFNEVFIEKVVRNK